MKWIPHTCDFAPLLSEPYFDPTVSKRLRLLATQEDTTVQELLAEALELLFRTRQAVAETIVTALAGL